MNASDARCLADELWRGVSFGLLGMTADNLTTRLAKLEDAGYVLIEKTFQGRRPATYLKLTDQGRAAYATYLVELQRLLDLC